MIRSHHVRQLINIGCSAVYRVVAALFLFALLGGHGAIAQTNWGGVSITPTSGTVNPATGKLNVAISGSVSASVGNGAVNRVIVYYDNKETLSQSYPITLGPDGETPINATRNFSFTLPIDAGSRTVQLGASTTAGTIGYTNVVTVSAAGLSNSAKFISQNVPSTMVAGQTYSISVTMQNNGSKTWSTGGTQPHRLGSQNPQDNTLWLPTGRVALTGSVAQNGSTTFNFNVTAPNTGGTYNFQTRMVQDGVEWFGDSTPNVAVVVTVPQPSAAFGSPNEGAVINASGSSASVTFTGTATPGSGATLSSVQLRENGTSFATGSSTISGSKVLTAGVHNIELRVVDSRGQVASVFRSVKVVPPAPSAAFGNPYNGAVIPAATSTASVPISATATPSSGASISQMRLYLDNVLVPGATSSSGTLSTTQTLTAGGHQLGVEATDNFGSVSTRALINVTVQAPAPNVSMVLPGSDATVVATGSTAAVTVQGSATAVGGVAITGLELIDNGVSIDPGTGSASFNKVVQLVPGLHTLSLRATNAAKVTGSSTPVNVTVINQVAGDSAIQSGLAVVASPMTAGGPYMVTVNMLNNGTTTWSEAANYRLGAQNPQDNRTWGGRAFLGGSVAPGQVATFTFPVTAPSQQGNYNFQWRMVREGVAWFGATTANVVVSVGPGVGPVMSLAATPTNVRVSGTQTKTITFTGMGSRASGTVTKLELFQNSGRGFGTTPVLTTTGNASTLNFNSTLTLPVGVYGFRLRGTDSAGGQSESAQVFVNVTNSALLGTVTGVRSKANGGAELVGWVCQPGNVAALSYQVLLDAPTPLAGGVLLTQGSANVATEADNSAVASQCGSGGHHFVLDLASYIASYAGRSVYIYAQSVDASASVTLPCADNNCTMPGTTRIGLTTPASGDQYAGPATVFMRAQVSNASGPVDEVSFSVDGGNWITGTADAAPGAYYANSASLLARAAAYSIEARVRQGNATLYSIRNLITVGAGSSVVVQQTSPVGGTNFNPGAPIALSATATGSAVQSVQFYANGSLVGSGSNSGGVWSSSWSTSVSGAYALTAQAFDGGGHLLSASPAVNITVGSSNPVSSSTPIPVVIDTPHLGNANAGTLPGSLDVGLGGEATYSIALVVPPGTAGLAPELALNYNSAGTNGAVGLGWTLSGLSSIHRCGKTIAQDGVNGRINFDKGDRLCLDGERLVLINAPLSDDAYWADNAVYRTEIDSFLRVSAQGAGAARTFKVERKDGKIMTFGDASPTVNARVFGYVALVDGVRQASISARADAQSWALDKIVDRSGNFITFHYVQTKATGEHLIDAIRYGGKGLAPHAMVKFSYEGRTDTWTRYIDGTRHDLRQRTAHIKTYAGDDMSGEPSVSALVRDYSLVYEPSPTSGRSLLKQVAVSAVNPGTGVAEALPATVFEWGKPDATKRAGFISRGTWSGAPLLTTHASTGFKSANHPEYFTFQDMENHGYTDVLERRTASPADPAYNENPATAPNPEWPGTMKQQYRYFHNNGNGFDQFQYQLDTNEKFAVLELGDFNGDGAPDLLVTTEGGGAKICLSPLRNGVSGISTAPIIFTCASAAERPAMGANTVDGIPYVVDVVGDGRSAIYGDISNTTHTASLYLQQEKLLDTDPPYSVLPYTPEDRRNTVSDTLQTFVSFDQMVDFAGIGKHADVRWALPYVRPPGMADNGEPIGSLMWVNLAPTISITDFRKPGTPRLGGMRSYWLHDEYPAPACVIQTLPDSNSRVACDPAPYRFDAPLPTGGAVADFSGSGYSNLMFGFVEIDKFNSATRADATLCLSTGRELDCGALAQHSGDQYKVVQAIANFVGDGAPSILMQETARGTATDGVKTVPVAVGPLQMCRLTGMGETPADTRSTCTPWSGLTLPGPAGGSTAVDQVYFMDLLGTGRTQAVYYHAGKFVGNGWQEDGRWEVLEPVDVAVDGQALDRIYQVTNGLGAVSNVEYRDGLTSGVVSRRSATDLTASYPQRVALGAGKLVSRLKRANGVAGQQATSYRYFDPATDVAGRGSLGFGAVETHDEQSGITTTTSYSLVWPKKGLVRGVVVTSAGGVSLASTTNTLDYKQFTHPSGEHTYLPFVAESAVERYDLDPDHSYMGKVTTTNTYDDYGNLTKQHVSSTADNKTFVADVASTFLNTDSSWLIGLPSTVTTTRTDPVSGTKTRVTKYDYDTTTGLRTKATVQPGEKAYELLTEYLRPSQRFGLVEETRQTWTDPLTQASRTRSVKTAYDDKGRYPLSVTNAENLTERYQYVPGTGARSELSDVNQLLTKWSTDGFGRVLVESRSDGNETRSFLKVCDINLCPEAPGAAVVQIVEQFHGAQRIAVPGLSFSDSVGHLIRSQSYAYNGDATYTVRRYDTRGRLTSTSQPAYASNGAPALASSQEYDDLNRVTAVTVVDEAGANQTTRTEYKGLTTRLINPKNQVRVDLRNAIGQVVKVTDAMAGGTTFLYEPFGGLTTTTDPRNNVINVDYDKLGRRIALNDPDLGRIEYTVDPLGRVRKQSSQVQRDALQSTEIDFDGLDRMTVRKEGDLTAGWTYDTAVNGKGQLAQTYTLVSSNKDYIRTHTYDTSGRPASTVQTLSDGVYTSQTIYDIWGRVVTQQYLRGSDAVKQFDMRYNDKGYLSWVERAGQKLWSVSKQDAANRATEVLLGNGLTQILTYNDNSARLAGDQLKTASGYLRLDQGYAYDSLGNVSQRTQYWDQSGFIEDFKYDDLNRLTSSKLSDQPTQVFAYFADGSLRSKTGVGTGDYEYLEQGANAVRPHAVKSIAGGMSFSYDNNGNVKTAGNLSVSWTSFDMPKLISRNGYSSGFIYGSEHQRVRQDRGDGTTIVYAGAQEVETKGTVVTVRTYWPMGIGLEIDSTGKPQQMNWIHKDRLGSPVALTGPDGAIVEKLAYDAWGKRRTPDGSSTADSIDGVTDHRGYTGHEMLDQLDLVHMNGRVYDPLTAKFLSGDPLIQDPMNGQNYNRYSYVLNNPTNLTDPTGFCANGTEQTGTKICAKDATTAVSDGEGGTKLVSTKVLLAALKGVIQSVGLKLSNGFVLSDAKQASSTIEKKTDISANSTPATQTYVGMGTDGVPYTYEGPAAEPKSRWQQIKDGAGDFVEGVLHAAEGIPGEGVVVGGIARLGRAAYAAEKVAEACCCFPAGTPVVTENGTTPIEQIHVGQLVRARDETTGLTELKPVTKLFITRGKVLFKLTTRSAGGVIASLEVTDNHPFWVEGRGWTESAQLLPGMVLKDVDDAELSVVDLHSLDRSETTFNFTVADFHTYFAGPQKAFVHNACKCVLAAEALAKNERALWQMTSEGTAKVMQSEQFGKVYKSASDGLWWSKDLAGHGDSAWKVFRETSKGLEWVRDADKYGNFMYGKHKGDVGTFIPWNRLFGGKF